MRIFCSFRIDKKIRDLNRNKNKQVSQDVQLVITNETQETEPWLDLLWREFHHLIRDRVIIAQPL
jgi:Trm5-related predicted tRNA methylase